MPGHRAVAVVDDGFGFPVGQFAENHPLVGVEENLVAFLEGLGVITSYSIHYTKLYEFVAGDGRRAHLGHGYARAIVG